LKVIGEEELAKQCEENPNSVNLFKALVKIKEKTKCPRIQLHMFGLYITLQNCGYKISPENNRKGMVLAASVAAYKAKTGTTDNCGCDALRSLGLSVSDVGLDELRKLSKYLKRPNMMEGIPASVSVVNSINATSFPGFAYSFR
jgi:ADP-dependent phosphofructokinase/glucokinase